MATIPRETQPRFPLMFRKRARPPTSRPTSLIRGVRGRARCDHQIDEATPKSASPSAIQNVTTRTSRGTPSNPLEPDREVDPRDRTWLHALMSPLVEVDRSDLVELLRTLDVVVVSLDRIGSWSADQRPEDAAAALMMLHVEMGVSHRLASARRIVDAYFSHEVGDDRMDDAERAVAGVEYWTAP